MKPPTEDLMTSRLVAYGSCAEWRFEPFESGDDKYPGCTLYQSAPGLYDPAKEMIEFVVQATRLATAPRDEEWHKRFNRRKQAYIHGDVDIIHYDRPHDPTYSDETLHYAAIHVPGDPVPNRRQNRLGVRPPHPVAAEMWFRLFDLHREEDAQNMSSMRGHLARIAYKWVVWCDGKGYCDLAFTAYFKDGTPQTQFDFGRTDPATLEDLLQAGDKLRGLFQI